MKKFSDFGTNENKLEGLKMYITFTNSKVLMDDIQKYENEIPFETIINSVNNKYYSFT